MGDTIKIPGPVNYPGLVGDSNGLGDINTFYPSYSAPSSIVPTLHSIFLEYDGKRAEISVDIAGFSSRIYMPLPESYSDQSYPMAMTAAADGTLYVTSVVIDVPGWEWWAVWKSTDDGDTWTNLDKFVKYAEGETHSRGMTTKGSDVYVCGMGWDYGVYNEEWLVRKSSDAGSTWSTVDVYEPTDTSVAECYSIVTAPSGSIIAGGYTSDATDLGIVRESTDNGATWTNIGEFSDLQLVDSVGVSPDGSIWAIGRNGNTTFKKGTYSMGTWTWSAAVDLGFAAYSNLYQKRIHLVVVDNTTAYFTTGTTTAWVIYKTSDGGATWSQVYNQSGLRGDNIIALANGDIVSTGSVNNTSVSVVRSTDGGSTWTTTFSGSTDDGGYLVQSPSGRIVLVTYSDNDWQMASFLSDDNSATFTPHKYIYYTEQFWSEVEDFAVDAAGNYYTVGWVGYTPDPTLVPPNVGHEPFVIMRSTDQGLTWEDKSFMSTTEDLYSAEIEADDIGNVYALGRQGNLMLLKVSNNNGATWHDADTYDFGGKVYSFAASLDENRDLYYIGGSNGNLSPLRKASSGGAVITDVTTLPLSAGYSLTTPYKIDVMHDGSLLVYVKEREDASSTYYYNLYKSTDKGSSWSLIYHSLAGIVFKEAPDGRFFLLSGPTLNVSRDGGVTYEVIPEVTRSFDDIMVTKDNRVLLQDGNLVYLYSDLDHKLKTAWDYFDVGTADAGAYVNGFYDCPMSPFGVCLNMYTEMYEGGALNYLYPLTNQSNVMPYENPSDLRSVSATSTQVDLEWRNSRVGVAGYRVVISQGFSLPPSCSDASAIDIGNTTSYSVPGLTPSTQYTARVCSYDGSGNLSSGQIVVIGTQTSTPEPTNFLVLPDLDFLELSWTAAGGATTGYQLAWLEGEDVPLDCQMGNIIDVGNVTSYQLNSLSAGTAYSVRVCSYDALHTLSYGVYDMINTTILGWNQESYIKAVNLNSSDMFGKSVAVSDDYIAVGVMYEDSNEVTSVNGETASSDNSSFSQGAVYIYHRDHKIWVQEAYLKAPNGESNDLFGRSIDISGDTIVVGAVNEDSNQQTITNGMTASTDNSAANSGAVYVFRKVAGVWQQEAYIKAANGASNDYFGQVVSIDGDILAVSAPQEDAADTTITNGTTASADNTKANSGAVYIYKRTGSTWVQEAYIKAANSDASDYCGVSIAASGDTVVVGCSAEDSNQITVTNGTTASSDNSVASSGAAYVYRRNNFGQWSQEAYLKAFNGEANDLFGHKVEIEGDTIAVGAPGEDSDLTSVTNGAPVTNNNTYNSGAIYIYKRTGTTWAHEAYVKAEGSLSSSIAGESLALSGNMLTFPSPRTSEILVYKRSAGVWLNTAVIPSSYVYMVTSLSSNYSQHNESISLSGETLVFSNAYDSYNIGQIFSYTIPEPTGSFLLQSGVVRVLRNYGDLFDPKGLTAIDLRTNEIDLSWESNIGFSGTGIKVAYAVGPTAPVDCDHGTVLDLGLVTSTTVSGLIGGTEYSFRICSYSAFSQTEGYTKSFITAP